MCVCVSISLYLSIYLSVSMYIGVCMCVHNLLKYGLRSLNKNEVEIYTLYSKRAKNYNLMKI